VVVNPPALPGGALIFDLQSGTFTAIPRQQSGDAQRLKLFKTEIHRAVDLDSQNNVVLHNNSLLSNGTHALVSLHTYPIACAPAAHGDTVRPSLMCVSLLARSISVTKVRSATGTS
jgi:hypothetical protein